MLHELPSHQKPFLRPVWGRIDRFPPLSPGQVLTTRAHVPEVEAEEALARLRAAGLVARIPKRPPFQIVGGTSTVADTKIVTYVDGFVITLEKDGSFLAQVGERLDHPRERFRTARLGDAVDAVLDTYRRRNSLPRSW